MSERPVAPLRVVVVEDSTDDERLLLRALSRLGYDTRSTRVENERKLRDALETDRWDIVLSDFRMPHMTAFDALRIVRERDPDLPFIIVSGTIGEEAAVDALKAGADDFLVKDRLARLGPAIERELREAEMRRQRWQAEAEVERQASALELLHRTAMAANESRSSEQAFRAALELLCNHLRWSLGHTYSKGVDSPRLTSTSLWHPPNDERWARFRHASEAASFSEGEGMVGRAVRDAAPVWVSDAGADPAFLRRDGARDAGIRTALAFPVLAGEDVAAVVELFHTQPKPLDEGLLGVLSNVGAQLGRVVERERAAKLERELRQAQKMEAMGRLAGGIAHDFNNLLTVIQSHVDFARQGEDPEAMRQDLATVADAADRAADLTRRLLTFSRAQVIERRVVRLPELVRDLSGMLGRIIGEDIELLLETATDTPLIVADRGQLEQIVMNLAINARDAMPEGGRLTIRTGATRLSPGSVHVRQGLAPGSYAQLAVTDTGTGIAPGLRERIFEPFFTTKDERGTGLGLSTVHGIVRQHQGSIELDSEPGRGTTFCIYLPTSEEAEESVPPASVQEGGPAGH